MSVVDFQKTISVKFTPQVVIDIVTKKSGLSDVHVQKIIMGDESKKGDSYLSNICRFTVEATGKNQEGLEERVSIPVIVKYLLQNVARRKTFRSAEFFENEAIFYQIWESFNKFQDSMKVKEKFDNIPLLLSAWVDGQNDYIALLDLSPEGYTAANRGTGLDYDHTIAVLHVLASFHSVSLAFKHHHPEEFHKLATSLKETYFSERLRPWYQNFQKRVFVVIRDAIQKELPPAYLQKLDDLLSRDLYGVLINACVDRSRLAVVTHGDVWPPNFLIKYDSSGKPGKVAMIDFQLTRYTSLATDLAFFLYACVDMALVESQWDELVQHYHGSLVQGLQKFGIARDFVTLEEVRDELKKHSVMGVGMSMEALIMAQLDDDDVCDLDAIQGDEAVPLESVWIVRPFKDENKRRRIASMIKTAVDKNFI